MRFAVVLSLVLVFAASGAAPALAGRNLVVGVNDDAVKWRPGISSISNDLGLGYYRVTQRWEPGQTQPSASDVASIDAAITNAGSQKILLSVFGSSGSAPRSVSSRAEYCSFVSWLPGPCPADRSRQHLERGQPELLLEAAVQSQRLKRCARRLRGADGALLRRDQALAPIGPCHHLDLAARQRQPSRPLEHLALGEELHQGDGEGIPAFAPPDSDLRCLGAESLRLDLEGAPVGAAPPRHRRGRLRKASFLPQERLRGARASRFRARRTFASGISRTASKRASERSDPFTESETDRAVVAPIGREADQASS